MQCSCFLFSHCFPKYLCTGSLPTLSQRTNFRLQNRKSLQMIIFSSTGQRPASYCHGIVSVVRLSVKVFRLVKGRLLLLDYLKQYQLLPFGALYNLIAKMHAITTSKFWLMKFMVANFFYYSINDRFIQRQLCVCMRACMRVCIC